MRGTAIGRRIPSPTQFFPAASFSTGRGRGIGGSGSSFFSPKAPGTAQEDDSTPASRESAPDGFGRGRGRGAQAPPKFAFNARTSGKPPHSDELSETPQSSIGHGRGASVLPSFSSFQSGIGRGELAPTQSAKPPLPRVDEYRHPVKPIFPRDLASSLNGAGRGKPSKQLPESDKEENRNIQVNRHTQARSTRQPKPKPSPEGEDAGSVVQQPRMSSEDAVKQAMSVLSRGGGGGQGGREDGQMNASGGRGRSGPALGRGRGRGRGRGFRGEGGRGRGRMRYEEEEDDDSGDELYLGDDADGEKLAKTIGVENMNKLVEGFEEVSERVLPSPLEDEIVEGFDINCKIEFEPEYLMGEFDQNPDIDETPPMSLRDMLEKVKPFMMTYEGIQSQEEWEEIIEETMKNAPLMKEIVDHYCGPDRVTAKTQQEELERIAKTIPASAPSSVKQFADRAVLSLQSNPGWGFDKKCQFMDKLRWEISRHYN